MNKKEKTIITAAIYARYSSHAQKEASIEQQVEACQKYARDNGLTVTAIYSDRALSGKTDRRPKFQQMLKDAKAGQFRCVLAWKSNRMGRNMLQAMQNEAYLNEIGIRVFYAEESFEDNAAGRFALRSMMNVNQFYSENMAEDIKRGLLDNAAACRVTNGHLPFGYDRDKNLRYIINELEAPIVREIFQRVADGEVLADIARDFNARGLKTSRGNPWGKSSFTTILRNERYMGIYIYGDVRIEGGVPQIVTPELFFRVQDALHTRKGVTKRHRSEEDYLLTGKLFCGYCGSPMTGVSGTSHTGSLHHYYICRKKRVEKACHKSNVRRDLIETFIAQAIKNHMLTDEVIEWIADSTVKWSQNEHENSDLPILEADLADVKRSIHNLMNAIEAGILTLTTKERLLELERQQLNLEARISSIRSSLLEINRDDLIAVLTLYRHGNIENKKYRAALFDTFLQSVFLYDDRLRLVFDFTGGDDDKTSITVPLDTPPDSAILFSSSFKESLGPPINPQSIILWGFSYIHNCLKTSPPT